MIIKCNSHMKRWENTALISQHSNTTLEHSFGQSHHRKHQERKADVSCLLDGLPNQVRLKTLTTTCIPQTATEAGGREVSYFCPGTQPPMVPAHLRLWGSPTASAQRSALFLNWNKDNTVRLSVLKEHLFLLQSHFCFCQIHTRQPCA